MSHIKFQFETSSSSHGRQRVGAPKPKVSRAPAKLPHITKLMALAMRLEHLLATGQVKDQAEIARPAGITRARVTQIINLTQLAPDIQEVSWMKNSSSKAEMIAAICVSSYSITRHLIEVDRHLEFCSWPSPSPVCQDSLTVADLTSW